MASNFNFNFIIDTINKFIGGGSNNSDKETINAQLENSKTVYDSIYLQLVLFFIATIILIAIIFVINISGTISIISIIIFIVILLFLFKFLKFDIFTFLKNFSI